MYLQYPPHNTNGRIHRGINTIQNRTIVIFAILRSSFLDRLMQSSCSGDELNNIFVINPPPINIMIIKAKYARMPSTSTLRVQICVHVQTHLV